MTNPTPIRPKWRGTMTDRERFNRQMHYQPIDRCFNMEFGYWQECFDQWPLFREHGVRSNGQADVFFSFDRIRSTGKPSMHPPFEEKTVRVTATSRIMINGDGLLAEVPLDAHGKALRIMGGVDKMQLARGPEAIRAYLDTLVPLVERGGYIPFCDHRCPPNVKPEDYRYYLDLKERMFGQPSGGA